MLTQTKPTSGNGVTFLYGPGDERIWAIDWTQGPAPSNWRETWTLRDLDGSPLRQIQVTGGNTSTANYAFRRDYVYRGGLLAAHTPQGRRHYHLDHLGSPRMITDATGKTLAQHLYFPFGEEATNPGQNDEVLKFTGHERDDLDATGSTRDLDYMHARYFSMHLGRFHSIDPVGGVPELPQSWNRYGYVLGNPVLYTDPRGLFVDRLLHLVNQFIYYDETTVTASGYSLPMGFANFLGFGAFLRNLGLFSLGATPAPPPQWVNPTGGCIRGCDSRGCGGFGASRDGGSRPHEGADFLSTTGQDVFAPTSGTLTRPVRRVYRHDARYTGFVLSGQNGFTIRAFYVATDPALIGKQVTAGDVLGTAQDLTLKYPGISNHVHIEIRNSQRQLIDPATVIPLSSQCP